MSSFTDFSLLAEGSPGGLALLWEFLQTGGYVMLLIVCCSVVAVMCMIIAGLHLRQRVLMPPGVVSQLRSLPSYAARGDITPLQQFLERDGSLLSRLASIAVSGKHTTRQECIESCANAAREELHRLEKGIPILEVLVSVAPLLGLLGTTVGLVGMFTEFGHAGTEAPDTSVIAGEIGVALKCTIAGLFVAVPSVIAHTLFTRKLDAITVRLETVLFDTIQSFYQHFEVRRAPEDNIISGMML